MIDWITMRVPYLHNRPVCGGTFAKVNRDGELEWYTLNRLGVTGSYDTGITIRSVHASISDLHNMQSTLENKGFSDEIISESSVFSHLEISGNAVKWLQGHNLWGSDDLPGLVHDLLADLIARPELELNPTDDELAAWDHGDIVLSRVDCTESFHLGSLGEVLAWLRAAEQTAHLSHRGRGSLVKGSTLYFGKNSRRWSLKLYAKGQEIQVPGHGNRVVQDLPSAIEWANKALRAEITLRGLELQRMGLRTVSAWFPVDGSPVVTSWLLKDKLGDMTMTTTRTLSDEVLSTLTGAQRVGYHAWLAGNDLRDLMSTRAFYRLRAKLLPHGIDIATLMPKEVSNVVPLHRVLEAKLAEVPEWAIGTPLYYEPTGRRFVA